MYADLAPVPQHVEDRFTTSHRNTQLGVLGVGEPVHDVQGQGRFGSGVLGGEVDGTTTTGGRDLVAVAMKAMRT